MCAWRVGTNINNMIMNSLIHGFADKPKGERKLDILKQDNNLIINDCDNGRRLDEGNIKPPSRCILYYQKGEWRKWLRYTPYVQSNDPNTRWQY